MLSARHNKSKPGQSKATLPPLAQLAAARAEHRAAESARASAMPSAPAPDAAVGTARILAFPGAAHRAAAPSPEARARWPEPSGSTPDRHAPAVLHAARADTARCLTMSDRIALLEWTSQGSGGYARVVLEEGVPGDAPDRSGYVLLYRQCDCWATFGLTRRAAGILVWRCSDGSAHATYPTMAAALAALPPAARAS